MKEENNYLKDISDIRTMMERSSKFLSLSGWAGIMAGVYALAGSFIAYSLFHFNPQELSAELNGNGNLWQVVGLALVILILSVSTAIYFSGKRAKRTNQLLWNPISRILLVHMLIPLIVGGLIILILISRGFIGWLAPFTLIFYGLALFNAGKFTYPEVKTLGLIEIVLGLAGACYIEFGLLLWALGFGIVHIIYGIYIHYRYER